MKFAWSREEKGVEIPAPYQRTIKVLFAPDKENIKEATLNQVVIAPMSKTHYHCHNKAEFIYIISGEGIYNYEGKKFELYPDVALYIPPEEKHSLVNTSEKPLKMITFFVPSYNAEELYNSCLNSAKEERKD